MNGLVIIMYKIPSIITNMERGSNEMYVSGPIYVNIVKNVVSVAQ